MLKSFLDTENVLNKNFIGIKHRIMSLTAFMLKDRLINSNLDHINEGLETHFQEGEISALL